MVSSSMITARKLMKYSVNGGQRLGFVDLNIILIYYIILPAPDSAWATAKCAEGACQLIKILKLHGKKVNKSHHHGRPVVENIFEDYRLRPSNNNQRLPGSA